MAKSQYESKLFKRIMNNSAKVKHEINEYHWGSIESYTMRKDDSDESPRFHVAAFHDNELGTTFSGFVTWVHPEWGTIELFNSLDCLIYYETLSDLMIAAVTSIAKECDKGDSIWGMAEDALKWFTISSIS